MKVAEIDHIDAEHNQVFFKNRNHPMDYDMLVIATGAQIRPDQTPGLLEHEWHKSIHDFYTLPEQAGAGKHLYAIEGVDAWW